MDNKPPDPDGDKKTLPKTEKTVKIEIDGDCVKMPLEVYRQFLRFLDGNITTAGRIKKWRNELPALDKITTE